MRRVFFATTEDLHPVLAEVEHKHAVSYTLAGMFASPELVTVASGSLIACPLLGLEQASASLCPCYLVVHGGTTIHVRAVAQRKGGISYAVDQLDNPDSIALCVGGRVKQDLLLPGSVGTASTTAKSAALHRAFASAITKHFTRVGAYWVGQNARLLGQRGVRLTIGAKSPREYDLAL